MSERTNFFVGMVAGLAIGVVVVAVSFQSGSTSTSEADLRAEAARLEAEVEVDSRATRASSWDFSDMRTRAGNLAVLKERIRQLEERRRDLDLNWQLAPRL